MIRHEAPTGVRSEELSRYLRRAWPLLPGHVLRDLLKKRDVRINGARSGRGDAVRGGDILEIYGDARYFEPGVDVLFDDGHLLAAVKPQGLPALPDQDGVGADTMDARLRRIHPQARLCHRLDAATGGVMLAALDDATEAAFFAAFREHALKKRYRAVLCCEPPRGEVILRAQLVKDARRASVRVLDKPAPGSKEIVTRVRPLGAAGDGLFLAELEPVTGRTHQLRAHMAHIGCPILGDDKYGDREINKKRGFAGRLCLWCAAMEIPGESSIRDYAGMKFCAEAPEWLKK